MRTVCIVTATLFTAILASALCADPQPPLCANDLVWMAGHWVDADDARSEELWLPPAGGMLIGVHRDTRSPEGVFYEYLRVETKPEGVFYVAKPSNQSEAAFRFVVSGSKRAEFENPDHDYPQRIVYALDGDVLTVTISGIVDGVERSSRWVMKRAPLAKEKK